MIRDLGGAGHRLRVWTDGDWPIGAPPAAFAVCAEWAGRLGHPTSYGLLGGFASAVSTVACPANGEIFEDSIAGRLDQVRFGLPDEYRRAIRITQAALRPSGLTITTAAHGRLGSSEVAFARLTRLLAVLAEPAHGSMTGGEINGAWARTWPSPDPPLSQAVVAYIGWGSSPSPLSTNGEARIADHGLEPAPELTRRVEELLDECDHLTTPTHDPANPQAANELRSYVALVHGELNHDATDAICWRSSWTSR